jgi:hypothetical protein
MLPAVAEPYLFSMHIRNTLLESYKLMVYKYTPATVQRHVQHAENATPAWVMSIVAASVKNDSLLDYLTSDVAL